MKKITTLLAFAILLSSNIIFGQTPSFYDLTFEDESLTSPYKSSNTHYAYIKSKRGTSGVNTNSTADSIKTFTISKIVLVFSEETSEAADNREEYNQERWENLMLTYPEFFQTNTVYKNTCQCTPDAAGDAYKQAQGFYIYYKTKAAPVVEQKTEIPAAAVTTNVTPTDETPVAKKVEAPPTKTETKAAEPVVKEEPKQEVIKQESVKQETTKQAVVEEEEAPPVATKKKTATNKPKKSKDPKACRPACYGYGDDDLVAYFKDNIKFSKKQKKRAKKATTELKIQLGFDGTIKKTMAIGADQEINNVVLEAAKNMNPWNAAVKGGTAIKSEVRITFKFDKVTKTFKPGEVVNNPRPNPKCKCVSDSEIFGD